MLLKSHLCPILSISEKLMSVGNNVLLNQQETNENEDKQHNSVQCDRCWLWYHLSCEYLTIKEAENLSHEWFRESCLVTNRNITYIF